MDKIKTRVKGILNNPEKFARFESLLNFPLPSSRLIDNAADEYLKAFDAEDRYEDYQFSDETLNADAADTLDRIKFEDWLRKSLFNQCLRASAAVWIVDLPAQVNLTGYAEPVVMLREVGVLTDVYTDRWGVITAIIFPMSPLKDDSGKEIAKRWAVLDDASYRVFVQQKGAKQPYMQFANRHALNRCPAGWIWHDRMDENQPIRIQSPLHAVLSDLDDLVIGNVFRQHADLYASFPILWSYRSRCHYVTIEGETCREGFVTIKEKDGDGILVKKEIPCPACSKTKALGPGSHLQPPQPQGGPESADLREPAGFINASRELLDYNVEKLDALAGVIRETLTGDTNNVDQTKEAVNEDQVQARFEARKSKVSYWASHLQQTHQECLWVYFMLRYGSQLFIDVAIDYGTEFHLLSSAQAIADYEAARKANLPMYQLAIRRQRIDKILAGANEGLRSRNQLLAELEPYPDLPLIQVPVGSDAYELKADFSRYIARFERENYGLETFGKALSEAEKISIISQTLYEYVSESKPRRQVPEPTGPERTVA